MKFRPAAVFPVLFTTLLLPSFCRADGKSLSAQIEEVTGGASFKNAHWGILVVDQDSGAVLYERDADQLFAPASTTKLYSVASALNTFGADHRFETTVYRAGGPAESGVLRGDLILVAGGDLTLGGRTDQSGGIAFTDVDHIYADANSAAVLTRPDPLAGLNELARQIAATGVKRLLGDVVVDDRLFDHADGTGSGPSKLTPIVVNDNVVDFLITPTRPGSPATIEWRPKTSAIQVDARVETVESNAPAHYSLSTPSDTQVVLRGAIAAESKPHVLVQEVDDPASFARSLFIEALQRAGIEVETSPLGKNRAELLPRQRDYDQSRRLALLTSPPFSEEAKLILKVSHNLHASILPLLVAAAHGQRTLADGLHCQRDFLKSAGVDVDSISFGGGAGGAPGDFTTPRASVQLLRHMATRPDFSAYRAALPVLGVDGTLTTVVGADSPARGKVWAKTGTLIFENTMNDEMLLTSKALAGYMTTAKNRKLILALYLNNVHLKAASDVSKVGATLGHLCEIICQAE